MLEKGCPPDRETGLPLDLSVVAVRFREPAPQAMRAAAAAALGLLPFPGRVQVPDEKYTLFRVAEAPAPEAGASVSARQRAEQVMVRADAAREVARAAGVRCLGPHRVLDTDRVIVVFRDGVDRGRQLLEAKGLKVVGEQEQRFVAQLADYEDPGEVAAELERTLPGAVEFAEPDSVILGRHLLPFTPAGDEKAPAAHSEAAAALPERQYALRLTRAREAQRLLDAHTRGRARSGIRIAVLDAGIDLRHRDLVDAFLPGGQGVPLGFDAVKGDFGADPRKHDSHGTACASLAAGAGKGADGVLGTGAGCSLLPVRICESDPEEPEQSWKIRSSWVAAAVDWARENGADVLSLSWGIDSSQAVAAALERARREGRGGKGCVIVAAAGNHEGPVIFPACMPGVLAVAASNADEEPKTQGSKDGETGWASSSGPQVEIAAPGVRLYAADNTGESGFTRTESPGGDHREEFRGTSGSAALVAGAAALVLAANPELEEGEVRRILCGTAKKVGTVAFDPTGHSERMGFGRLDVLAAVRAALGLPPEDGGGGADAGREDARGEGGE